MAEPDDDLWEAASRAQEDFCAALAPDALVGPSSAAAETLRAVWQRLRERSSHDERIVRFRELFDAGDAEAAATLGLEMLQQRCPHSEVHLDTGLTLAATGDLGAAVRVLGAYLAMRPDDPAGWTNLLAFMLRRARAERTRELLDETARVARSAVRLHPAEPDVQRNAAEVFCDFGDLEGASIAAWSVNRARPGDPAAVALMEKVLALQADTPSRGEAPERDYAVGAYHLNQGDPERALPFLREAYEQLPRHPAVAPALGEAHLALGDPRQAVAILLDFVGTVPDSALAWGTLGRARLTLNDARPSGLLLRLAQRDLQRALTLAPDVAELRISLAECYRLDHNVEDARAELEEARRLGSEEAVQRLAAGILAPAASDETE